MSEYLKSDCVKPLGCPGVRTVAPRETAYTRERADCDNDADKTSFIDVAFILLLPVIAHLVESRAYHNARKGISKEGPQ